MPIQIDRMESHIEVVPPEGGSVGRPASAPGPATMTAAGHEDTVEALRPLVAAALARELDGYRRMFGGG